MDDVKSDNFSRIFLRRVSRPVKCDSFDIIAEYTNIWSSIEEMIESLHVYDDLVDFVG